jgi:hypothetical protein
MEARMKRGTVLVLWFELSINPTTHSYQWRAKEHKNGVKTMYVATSSSDGFPDTSIKRFHASCSVIGNIGATHNHKIRIVSVHIIAILYPQSDRKTLEQKPSQTITT